MHEDGNRSRSPPADAEEARGGQRGGERARQVCISASNGEGTFVAGGRFRESDFHFLCAMAAVAPARDAFSDCFSVLSDIPSRGFALSAVSRGRF